MTAGALLVIDIGGTSIKFGYSVDGRPTVFRKLFDAELLRQGDPLATLAGMIGTVEHESGVPAQAVVATVPGFVGTDGDLILSTANIPSLNGRRLRSELSRLIERPVLLERDAVLMLSGEVLAGVAQGADHVLGVFFGTGIGSAYLHAGQPFRGGGWALEIGLMPFKGDGRAMDGMRTDCLEAYASGRALQVIATRHGVPITEVFSAAPALPALSGELEEFIRHQAFAVAMATAMLSPHTLVLGGGVLEIAGYPKARLAELIERHAPIAETGRSMDLRWSEMGWLSVLHGAPAAVATAVAGAVATAVATVVTQQPADSPALPAR